MCDFFYLFRWGKKKDKDTRSPSADEETSRSRGKSSRHRSKSDDSAPPSGSRDKHGRPGSRSKSRDKKHASSGDRNHQHHDQEKRHHHHHRPSSSSASRPLRTPTTGGGQSSEPQYRQYRHNHRRENHHHQHHHDSKNQQRSPDENKPPPQQYTPSRPKRERRKKSQHGKSQQPEDGRSFVSDCTVGLRHEDLPLHPSIAKAMPPKALAKTRQTNAPPVTGSYQKNTFVRAQGVGLGGDQLFKRGWKRSRSESPSNLRAGSTGNSGSNPNLAGGSSVTGEGGGDQST
ncbi:hypothetical protein EGW08_021006 [Elysia chlorotica]|uniref:Uncharacterized protein n=1 Tax=Elysia chlorotica TaxID=188477 RepID=A0A433SPS2_ELYCH|nr:hypothetical protein EGW08_021006 [Elysia chlorotica]